MKLKDLIWECERILSARESDPPYVHWVLNRYGDDLEGDFCPECVKQELARVKAKQGDVPDDETRTTYEYPETEDDGCRHCETCGALLAYTLTDYGLAEEMAHFKDAPGWDWNDPDTCYELARIANSIYTEEQELSLLSILKQGLNPPAEIQAALK